MERLRPPPPPPPPAEDELLPKLCPYPACGQHRLGEKRTAAHYRVRHAFRSLTVLGDGDEDHRFATLWGKVLAAHADGHAAVADLQEVFENSVAPAAEFVVDGTHARLPAADFWRELDEAAGGFSAHVMPKWGVGH